MVCSVVSMESVWVVWMVFECVQFCGNGVGVDVRGLLGGCDECMGEL